MITVHKELEQGSSEWLQARCGIISASIMNSILTPSLRLADNDKTRQAVYDLASQRVTGYVPPTWVSDDMLRGVADEVIARQLYDENHAPVTEVGGIDRKFSFGTIWYSPDGLVGDDGLIEVKSRRQGLHFKTVSEGEIPKEHILQCQCALIVTGRKWIDYISICRGLPLFIKRETLRPEYEDAIMTACEEFENKITQAIDKYTSNMNNQFPLIETEREPDEEEMVI